jgi:hypothetical protein
VIQPGERYTEHWQDDAACRGADPDLFFPEELTLRQLQDVKDQYCDICPVRQACLADALSRPDTAGIHAGVVFPVVGPIVYAAALLRQDDKSWPEIAEILGAPSADSLRTWVAKSYESVPERIASGKLMINGRVVTPYPRGPVPADKEEAMQWVSEQRVRGCAWSDIATEFGISEKAVVWRHRAWRLGKSA